MVLFGLVVDVDHDDDDDDDCGLQSLLRWMKMMEHNDLTNDHNRLVPLCFLV